MAILPFQQNPWWAGVVDSKNDYRSGVMDEIATRTNAARFLDLVGSHSKDGAAVDRARREQPGLGRPGFFLRGSGGFRHADNIKHGIQPGPGRISGAQLTGPRRE